MRLDKYLKLSRIIKRRTVANDVADAGRITVNGRPAKASHQMSVGDILEVTYGPVTRRFKVTSVEEKVGKDAARDMFEALD